MLTMKYTLLRNSGTDQRVFVDEAGSVYLADHSGDSYGDIGRPDQTDDGPLKVVVPTELVANWYGGSGPQFAVQVQCERYNNTLTVCFGLGVASFLAERWGVPMKLRHKLKASMHLEFQLKKIEQ